jgi:hypothetical protein
MGENELGINYLKEVEYKIYNFLVLRLITHKTDTFTNGQKALAKAIDCHVNSISPAITSLMNKGWLQRTRNGKNYSLQLTLPEEHLQCRICYLTGFTYESFIDLKINREMQRINEKQFIEYERLKQEVQLLKTKEQNRKSKKKPLTNDIINDFVDKLWVRLGNSLDQRTLENKVLTEINTLKARLSSENSIREDSKQKTTISITNSDFKSNTTIDGYQEILRLKGKKLGE